MPDRPLTEDQLRAMNWTAATCHACTTLLGIPPDQTRRERLEQIEAHMFLCPNDQERTP